MAPTPYTAGQIRESNPPGTRLVFRIERAGEPAVQRVMAFVAGDAEHAVTESSMLTLSGEPLGEPVQSTATWAELRDHASFPAALTRREMTTVTVPAGTFDVWRYTVRSGDDGDAAVSTFFFALDRPGPPVLLETETGGEVTFRMVLIDDSRGG